MAARLLLGTEVREGLRHLHPSTKVGIRKALEKLAKGWPAPKGLEVKRLDSDPTRPPVFRLRVGNWRVVFRARGDSLQVVRVFHRREGYGWMERL